LEWHYAKAVRVIGRDGLRTDREIWDRVHAVLQESPRKRAARTRAETPALLKGLLLGQTAPHSRRRTSHFRSNR
jgi:hypothetical protein